MLNPDRQMGVGTQVLQNLKSVTFTICTDCIETWHWVYFSVPNLALIDEGVGMEAHKVQNLVKYCDTTVVFRLAG